MGNLCSAGVHHASGTSSDSSPGGSTGATAAAAAGKSVQFADECGRERLAGGDCGRGEAAEEEEAGELLLSYETRRERRRARRSELLWKRRYQARRAVELQRGGRTERDRPVTRDAFLPRGGMKSSSSSSSDGSAPVTRELLFKLLVIGDYGVGKTAIVRRYTEGKFSSNYKITIGADFALKTLQYDQNTKVNLQLWDIAGHERFGYMTKVYYKYASGAAIVFDVSRIATFHSAQKWLNDIREKVTQQDGTPIPTVLLANKCDIQGSSGPSTETIARFCRDNGITNWFSTSAKENINIDEAMAFLVNKVMYVKTQEAAADTIILSASTGQTKEKQRNCCG
ncbi:ras-related protein Rab-32-like [Schistocerca cancellata]|uniref:ras-related protein Rab-32-like n=1 Tax=Schistocerca cancellata TaxID=274614 RepID=UPI00211801AB|nr:ras-related protein Rab-32-like [Schistocerca cancellata]